MKTTLGSFASLSCLVWLSACQPDPLPLHESAIAPPPDEPADVLLAQAARIPRVTSVVPPMASNQGGATLTLNGRSFDSGTQVFVAGQPAQYIYLMSSTQITVQLPRAAFPAGPASVKVVSAEGRQSERKDVLTFFADTTALVGQRVPVNMGSSGPGADVVATGDLNGDGLLDLVAQDYSRLFVLIARSRGIYSEPQVVGLPSVGMPPQIAIADVNGDGKLDVVGGTYYGGAISAFLNRGDGSLDAPVISSIAGLSGYYGGTVADVNKDGRADMLLVVNSMFPATTPYSVAVYLGGSDGRFATTALYSGVSEPARLQVIDVNRDGHMDVVVAASSGSGDIGVLKGDSSGKFAAPISTSVDGVSRDSAVADLNGDGKPDLVSLSDGGKISLRPGKGDGSFGGLATLSVATAVTTLAVGDVTGDGRADLLVGYDRSYSTSGTVTVGAAWLLPGNGDTTFQAPQELNLFPMWGARKLRIADADKDGKADVLINSESQFVVLYGRGGGQFVEDRQFPGTSTAIASADLNGDGRPDVVSASVSTNQVYVSLNTGDGALAAPRSYDTDRGPAAVALADVTGDGKLDLVVANYDAGNVSVLPGNGDGSFQPQRVFPAAAGATALAVADMNGDSRPDVLTANYESNNVSVLLNTGMGTFSTAKNYSTGAGPAALAVADVNKDGRMDVVTANLDGNNASYLQGSAATAGALNSARGVTTGRGPVALVAQDVTGDGQVDLIVGNSDSGDVSLSSGRGDGTFAAPTTVAKDVGRVVDLGLSDINQDGRADLVLSTSSGASGSTRLYYGFAGGVFAPSAQTLDAGGPVAISDVAGDRKPDLLVARPSGLVLLFTNRTL